MWKAKTTNDGMVLLSAASHSVRGITRLGYLCSVLLGVAFLVSGSALDLAQAQVKEHDKRTISLSAIGVVKAVPDKVDITTGVTAEGQTARAALDKNTEAMVKVVDGLKEAGIAPKDIQTTNFSVSPIYERKQQGQAAFITGYRVSNQVHITVRDTDLLGGILDKVVTLGANQINSIRFGVSETEKLTDEARKQAMRDATANAQLYAETAGVELGPVLTINEIQGVVPQARQITTAAAVMSEDVPIEAGSTTVEVRLRVTWELR